MVVDKAEQIRDRRSLSLTIDKIAAGGWLILSGPWGRLGNTPKRIARFVAEWGQGFQSYALTEPLAQQCDVDDSNIIWVRDIAFPPLCDHHFLPFRGVAHVVHQPQGSRVTGLSKLIPVVNAAAGRLKNRVQERTTQEIADALRNPEPLGRAG